MRRYSIVAAVTIGICLMFVDNSYSAWVQSKNQEKSIRHPQGWRVVWEQNSVSVTHPQDYLISCTFLTYQWNGNSRQYIETMINQFKSEIHGLRVINAQSVSRQPDIYGSRLIYDANGVAIGYFMLVATKDNRNFSVWSYMSPAMSYDEMKLTLIAILQSYQLGEAGPVKKGGSQSSGKITQVLRSPNGFWQWKAPSSWKIVDMGDDEPIFARIEGPEGAVGVRFYNGYTCQNVLNKSRSTPQFVPHMGSYQSYDPTVAMQQMMQYYTLPYLPAADLIQRVLVPFWRLSRPDVSLIDLNPITQETARYAVAFTDQHQRTGLIQEGIVQNSPLSDLRGGDYNIYTNYWVASAAQKLPQVKNTLWQILNTFEPSDRFGAPMIQILMQWRQETQQAAASMIQNHLQTSQRIMRQTTRTTMKIMEDRRQEGAGWNLALSGEDVVRDPGTGKQYRIPIGGEYIYGKQGPGRDMFTIRSNSPIPVSELPDSFRVFEQVPLKEIIK